MKLKPDKKKKKKPQLLLTIPAQSNWAKAVGKTWGISEIGHLTDYIKSLHNLSQFNIHIDS